MLHRSPYGAVIVTFNPAADFDRVLQAIASQVARVAIVDNGSSQAFRLILAQLAAHSGNVDVIALPTNAGIAHALNVGLARMKELSLAWAYTFDHDSIAPPGFCAAMESMVNDADDVGVISPAYADRVSGTDLSPATKRPGDNTLTTTLASGNLVRLEAWERCGKFDDQYFIDYVDHEFCLRCAAKGYRIVLNRAATLQHSLGNGKVIHLLGRRCYLSFHSPVRRYYMTRNRFATYVRFFSSEPQWVWRDFLAFLKEGILVATFETGRMAKIGMMLRGFFDFLRHRSGPYAR